MAGTSSMGSISIDIEARLARFESDIGRAARLLKKEMAAGAARAEQQLSRMQRQLDATARAAQNVDRSVTSLTRNLNVMQRAATALGASFVAREIVQAGLQFERYNATLVSVTGSQSAATKEFAFLRREAERLGIYLPTLAETYMGLAAATRGTKLEGEATRDIFLAVAEAGRAFKLRADQVQGALYAVQQIASKGVVSMEELRRQLGDRIYGAFNIASRAMGVTTAEMNKLVASGKLLSEDFLPKFAAELRKTVAAGLEFATNSPAAEFDRLKTAIFEFAVVLNKSGFMDALVDAAKTVTKFLNESHGAAAAFGQALGFLIKNVDLLAIAIGARLIASMADYARRQLEAFHATNAAAAATVADAKAKEMAALASVGKARAEQAEAVILQERARLEYAAAQATHASTLAQQRQIRAMALRATSEIEMAQLSKALTAAELAQVQAAGKLEAARIAAVGTNMGLMTANQGLVRAKEAAATATGKVATAMAGLTGAAGRLGNGLVALAGGPIGAWVLGLGLAAYALYDVLQGSEEVAAAIEKSAKAAEAASTDSWSGLTAELIRISQALIEANGHFITVEEKVQSAEQATLSAAKADLAMARAKADAATGLDKLNNIFDINNAILNTFSLKAYAAEQQVKKLEAEVEKLASNQRFAAVIRGWTEDLKEFFASAGEAGLGMQTIQTSFEAYEKAKGKAIKSNKEALASLKAQRLELTKGVEARKLYELALTLEYNTVEELLAQTDDFTKARVAEVRQIAALTREVDGLKSAEEKRNKVLKDAKRHAAEMRTINANYQKGLDGLHDIIVATSAELDGPMKKALKANAEDYDNLQKAINRVIAAGAQSVEVYDLIAEAQDNASAAAERRIESAKREADIGREMLTRLDEEISLLGLKGAALETELILRDAIALAAQRNVEFSPTQQAALREEVMQRQKVIEKIKEQIEAQERYQQIVENSLNSMADALADYIVSGLEDWESFGEAMKNIWKRAIAEVISETLKLKVIKPFLDSLFGGSSGGGGIWGSLVSAFTGGGSGGGASGGFWSSLIGAFTGGGGGSSGGSMNWGSIMTSMLGGGGGSSGGSVWTSLLSSGGGNTSWLNTAASLFGIGGGGVAAAGAGASTIGAYSVYNSAVSSSLASYGVANTANGLGSTAAAGAAGGGASAASMAIPIIGWIIAGMMANNQVYRSGWRGNSPDGEDGGFAGGSSGVMGNWTTPVGADRLLQSMGMSEYLASMISGSALHTRLWGRRQPVVTNSNATLQLGPNGPGGHLDAEIYRRGGYFRSSDRRTERFELPEDAQDMVESLYDDIDEVIQNAARRLGTSAIPMLDAAFRIVHEMDKKGRHKATKFFVDALGRSWEEATEELAVTRLYGEAIIHAIDEAMGTQVPAVADAVAGPINDAVDDAIGSLIGNRGGISGRPKNGEASTAMVGEASAIAERWRHDAELLAQGAEFLLDVAVDMHNGLNLLGDGTMTEIVEFLEEFEMKGEGLRNTYARILVSTELLDNAVALSGVTIDLARQEFVRLATEVVEAMGGLDRARSLWTSFFEGFYDEYEQAAFSLSSLQQSVQNEFDDIGLSSEMFTGSGGLAAFRARYEAALPYLSAEEIADWVEAGVALLNLTSATEEYNNMLNRAADTLDAVRFDLAMAGMSDVDRELFEINSRFDQLRQQLIAVKATTAQLAELEGLRAQALAQFNAALELEAIRQAAEAAAERAEGARSYAEAISALDRELLEHSGASDFQLALVDIAGEYRENVAQLNSLARAAGLAGAREEDLARAMAVANAQRERAIASLEAEGRGYVEELFSPLDGIDREIAALQELEEATSSLGDFGDAISDVADAATNAVNLLLGDLSPLRDREKLQVALKALRAGQIGQEEVLRIGRRLFASGADYNQLFDEVMSIGDRRSSGGTGGGGTTGGNATESVAMRRLLDERDAILAQREQAERFSTATNLAQVIADIAGAREEDYEAIAQSLGLTGLDQLLADLNMESLEELTDYLDTLQANSYSIADIAAVVTAGEQLIVDTLFAIFQSERLKPKPPAIDKDPFWRDIGDGGKNPRPPVVDPFFDGGKGKSMAHEILDVNTQHHEELVALQEIMVEYLARVDSNTSNAAGSMETIATEERIGNARDETRRVRSLRGAGRKV